MARKEPTDGAATRDRLVERIREKTEGHRFVDPNLTSRSAHPPVSAAALDEAEEAIGYALPVLFRTLYGGVADGVWPGTRTLEEIVDASVGYRASSEPWPAGCIGLYEWGCGIESCIDLRSKRARVVRHDPHLRDAPPPSVDDPFDATRIPAYAPFLIGGSFLLFRRESDALEDWFEHWLDGNSARELEGMAPQSARRLQREADRERQTKPRKSSA